MAQKVNKKSVIEGLKIGTYKLIKYVLKQEKKQHEVWNTSRETAVVQHVNEPAVKMQGFIACVICNAVYCMLGMEKVGTKHKCNILKKHSTPNDQSM